MKLWVARNMVGWLGLYRTKPTLNCNIYGRAWVSNFMGFISNDLEINKHTLPRSNI